MIFGIGVDMATVARVEKSIARPGFLERVYSPEERALLRGLAAGRAAETAAANFAAKEAFLKAAGRGIGGFAFADMAVLRAEGGAPYFALAGQAHRFCEREGLRAHVSLTHEGGAATAFVVLERVGARVMPL